MKYKSVMLILIISNMNSFTLDKGLFEPKQLQDLEKCLKEFREF